MVVDLTTERTREINGDKHPTRCAQCGISVKTVQLRLKGMLCKGCYEVGTRRNAERSPRLAASDKQASAAGAIYIA